MKMLSLRCIENSGPIVPATQRRLCENFKCRDVGVGNLIVAAIRVVFLWASRLSPRGGICMTGPGTVDQWQELYPGGLLE